MQELREQISRMTDEKLDRELAFAEGAATESGLEAAWVDELRAEKERRQERGVSSTHPRP